MARTPRLHNLRFNAAERSPRRLLVVDAESRWETQGDREEHTLRLWCSRLVKRAPAELEPLELQDHDGWTADELADLVQDVAKSDMPTWLYTHNLSFDLTVTALPVLLLRRGWQLGRHNLASEQPWAHLARGSRSLQLADSASWLPRSLADLGDLLDVPKLELPQEDDSDDAWRQRCRRDVDITTRALLQLLAEWDRRQLGSWSITGPASGWNSMLHMAPGARAHRNGAPPPGPPTRPDDAPAQRTVIDPDPAARAFEREAIYSGRRDLWAWGHLPEGDYTELDFKAAHLTIAAHQLLPDRRGAPFDRLELDDWRIGSRVRSLIARCLVRCEEPRWPLRYGRAIWHPVGTFWTTLCGPEIADARDHGALLEIGAGYSYRLGRQMQPWAQWVLGLLDAPPDQVDPMLRVFLKGCSRSVPGRWAMMTGRDALSGPSHVDGWSLERAAFGRPPVLGAILHMAGRWLEVVRDQEGDDSFPAVLAHIQAWDRLLLQRGLDALPRGAVLQVNTDSMLLHTAALWDLAQWPDQAAALESDRPWGLEQGASALSCATRPLELRPKRQGGRCLVLSPQHVELAGERKFSGVPRSAVETDPYAFEFWTWPKLLSQLEHGQLGVYERRKRTVRLAKVPIPRWAYQCGCALPPRAGVTVSGESQLVGPDSDVCALHGARLRDAQHPVLERLR